MNKAHTIDCGCRSAVQRWFPTLLGAAAALSGVELAAQELPVITEQPASFTISQGETVTLRVGVQCALRITSYEWQFNGEPMSLPPRTTTRLTLTNVESAQVGEYRLIVNTEAGSSTSAAARICLGPVIFTAVRNDPVVNNAAHSSPGKWGDYDGDGYPDLFVQGSGLFHNQGDGTFRRETGWAIGALSEANNAQWIDFDNDGHLDFLAQIGLQRALFRNVGGTGFQRISAGALTADSANGRGHSWADIDNDGDLDYFSSNTYYESDFLYRNKGDGTFTRILDSPVARDAARAYGCSFVDYDRDGAMDLYLADIGSFGGFLYQNCGDGRFVPVAHADSGLLFHGLSIDSAWADYDNDGDLDVYISSRGYGNAVSSDALFENNGDGTFRKRLDSVLSQDANSSWGAAWADYDNDGHLDLFVPNGPSWGGAEDWDNFLYHNQGDGTFSRVTDSRVVHDGGTSWGASWADYDNDGFLDLFVANDGQRDFLYRNAGNQHGWLLIRLIGTASSHSAIGAWVEASAVISGKTLIQTRHIANGHSYGQPDARVHFGLGDATQVDRLRIEWPSGTVQELENVAIRQILEITEPLPDQILIVEHPRSQSVPEGRPAKLVAKVSGPQPLTFQWQHQGADLAGATHRILYLERVSPADAGDYRLTVAGPGLGQVITDNATLSVLDPLTAQPHRFHAIHRQPAGGVSVQLEGKLPPGYLDRFQVEASEDLTFWTPLPPLATASGSALYSDSLPAADQRFFRLLKRGVWTAYPLPGGPYAVGTMRKELERGRSAAVLSIWYPGEPAVGMLPEPWFEAPYVQHLVERFGPGMAILSQVHGHSIPGLSLLTTSTPWPALVFSHAYAENRDSHRDLCEELASHGFIVVAMDHLDADSSVLADGTVVRPRGDIWNNLPSRVAEARFVLDQLTEWNMTDPFWAGRIDLERLGAFGSSLGGETAAELGRVDGRCRSVAVIGLEPFWAFYLDSAPLNKPTLLLLEETVEDIVSGDIHINNPALHLFQMSPGPAYYLRIEGTQHHSLSGLARVVAPHVAGGTTDNWRAASIAARYLVSFFRKHLLEDDDGLMDGPTPEYPEATPFLVK